MKITIIIPVYNTALFLDRCILSALCQPQTGEVLLIDDRSTDESLEICKEWVIKDDRVRLFRNEGVNGAGAARNIGLNNSNCDFIAFLDADDYYLDGRFDSAIAIFEQYPDVEVVSDAMQIVTFDGRDHLRLNMLLQHNSIFSYPESFSYIDAKKYNYKAMLPITGLTIRREVVDRIGYFDETLKQAEDTDWVVRMLSKAVFMSGDISHPIVVYNIHEHNTTTNYTESVYYRRKKAKKLFKSVVRDKVGIKTAIRYLKDFMEYDYLWVFRKNHRVKKYIKAVLFPFFVYRLFAKTDPLYDAERIIDIH